MTPASRLLLVVALLFIAFDGWWALTHSADTPRYSSGYGSGFSPSTRRLLGGVALVGSFAAAVLTVVL